MSKQLFQEKPWDSKVSTENSPLLLFVAKYSQKRSLTISWCLREMNTRKQHVSPMYVDSFIYEAKVQFFRQEINSVFIFAAESLIWWVTVLLSDSAQISFMTFHPAGVQWCQGTRLYYLSAIVCTSPVNAMR